MISLHNQNVVIVEDEHIVALDIKLSLQRNGFLVPKVFSRGEELLQYLEKGSEHPDIILMDIHLAGNLSGIEVSAQVADLYRIPVIILTAYADPLTVEKTLSTLPYGYLLKPFNDRELQTAITIALLRHRVQVEAENSRDLLNLAIESLPDGILVSDGSGAVVQVNQRFLELYAVDRDAILGSSINRIIEQYSMNLDGSPFELIASPGNSTRWLEAYQGDLPGGNLGTIVSCREVTARLNAERQLAEARQRTQYDAKMEALGRLSGGIAHDFNNLMTIVSGHASNLKQEYEAVHTRLPEETAQIMHNGIDGILAAAKKSGALVRQLLTFSRNQVMKKESVPVDQRLSQLHDILQRLMIGEYKIVIDTDASDKKICINTDQFEQVVINLVLNARDAMISGGLITISTRVVKLEQMVKNGMEAIPAGLYLALSVADQGNGIPPATLEKIFDPFFSTKEGVQGFGLGLSIVYGIVKQSKGYIRVNSELNRGTVFELLFPSA